MILPRLTSQPPAGFIDQQNGLRRSREIRSHGRGRNVAAPARGCQYSEFTRPLKFRCHLAGMSRHCGRHSTGAASIEVSYCRLRLSFSTIESSFKQSQDDVPSHKLRASLSTLLMACRFEPASWRCRRVCQMSSDRPDRKIRRAANSLETVTVGNLPCEITRCPC